MIPRIFLWENKVTGVQKTCGVFGLAAIYDLDTGHLYKVANGKRKSHKNWTMVREFTVSNI